MTESCDKCLGKIVNGRCPCGIWLDPEEQPNFLKTLENAMMAYDHMCEQHDDDDPLTGDHHSGICIALWKGSYEDCEKVKQFIKSLS